MKSCNGCLIVVVLTLAVCYVCASADETEPPVFHDHRYFLRQIFNKYGDEGIITFEVWPWNRSNFEFSLTFIIIFFQGFEHLLENLGLGRLSFDKEHSVSMHRINGSFQDVHDALKLHDHRHGPKEIADFYLNNINVSSQEAAHFSEADEVFEKTGDFAASTIVKRSAGVNGEARFCYKLRNTIKLSPNRLHLSCRHVIASPYNDDNIHWIKKCSSVFTTRNRTNSFLQGFRRKL